MLTPDLIDNFMKDVSPNAETGARVEHFRKKMASEYQNVQGRAAAEADLDDRQRELLKECRSIGWTFGPDAPWLKRSDLTADTVRQVVADCGGDRDRAAKFINRTNFDSPSQVPQSKGEITGAARPTHPGVDQGKTVQQQGPER